MDQHAAAKFAARVCQSMGQGGLPPCSGEMACIEHCADAIRDGVNLTIDVIEHDLEDRARAADRRNEYESARSYRDAALAARKWRVK